MTVIAYRDGVLAADTLATQYGSVAAYVVKIARVEGWLLGSSGNLGGINHLRTWARDGANPNDPISFDKTADCVALLVDPTGRVFYASTESPTLSEVFGPYHAIGSGSDAARAALLLGCDARRAVEVASAIDRHCGGRVHFLALDGTGDVELPGEIYKLVNTG